MAGRTCLGTVPRAIELFFRVAYGKAFFQRFIIEGQNPVLPCREVIPVRQPCRVRLARQRGVGRRVCSVGGVGRGEAEELLPPSQQGRRASRWGFLGRLEEISALIVGDTSISTAGKNPRFGILTVAWKCLG